MWLTIRAGELMLSTATREKIERFWSMELDCAIDALRRPGITVVPRAQPGAFLLRYGDACVFSVPERLLERVVEATGHRGAAECFDVGAIKAMLTPGVTLILGPCPIGYLEQSMWRAPANAPSRRLNAGDAAEVEDLAQACGSEAWEHGGIEWGVHDAVFGAFAGGRLAAAASYERWGDAIAHVGVVTSPASRGKGLGKMVAAAAAQHALSVGLIPQWRTLASNHASVAVGKALGFETVATHYFARLATVP